MKTLNIILFIGLIVTIGYFSWVPDPDLMKTGLIPDWLGKWTNQHGVWRTAIPFTLLGLVAWPLAIYIGGTVGFLKFVTVLIFAAEGIQSFLPDRHPDYRDVVVAYIGALIGYALSKIMYKRKNLDI